MVEKSLHRPECVEEKQGCPHHSHGGWLPGAEVGWIRPISALLCNQCGVRRGHRIKCPVAVTGDAATLQGLAWFRPRGGQRHPEGSLFSWLHVTKHCFHHHAMCSPAEDVEPNDGCRCYGSVVYKERGHRERCCGAGESTPKSSLLPTKPRFRHGGPLREEWVLERPTPWDATPWDATNLWKRLVAMKALSVWIKLSLTMS